MEEQLQFLFKLFTAFVATRSLPTNFGHQSYLFQCEIIFDWASLNQVQTL